MRSGRVLGGPEAVPAVPRAQRGRGDAEPTSDRGNSERRRAGARLLVVPLGHGAILPAPTAKGVDKTVSRQTVDTVA